MTERSRSKDYVAAAAAADGLTDCPLTLGQALYAAVLGFARRMADALGGLRLATAVDLLSSLDTPVVVVDNKGKSVCWCNSAFDKLCRGSNDSSEERHQQADFLQALQDAPSSSSKKPGSITWQKTAVFVAWEHAVEGETVRALGHRRGMVPPSITSRLELTQILYACSQTTAKGKTRHTAMVKILKVGVKVSPITLVNHLPSPQPQV